jgi:hypothetical protein
MLNKHNPIQKNEQMNFEDFYQGIERAEDDILKGNISTQEEVE